MNFQNGNNKFTYFLEEKNPKDNYPSINYNQYKKEISEISNNNNYNSQNDNYISNIFNKLNKNKINNIYNNIKNIFLYSYNCIILNLKIINNR
jgi:hypothetical protein